MDKMAAVFELEHSAGKLLTYAIGLLTAEARRRGAVNSKKEQD